MDGTRRILLVDDDASLLRVIEKQLEGTGFTVTTARSAPEALAVLETGAFDLVLTDLAMEGMGGLELLAEVRRGPGPPVIVMTAWADAERRRAARRLGAAGFLEKPFSREVLLSAVRGAFPEPVV